jgi:flagellar motor component MotA
MLMGRSRNSAAGSRMDSTTVGGLLFGVGCLIAALWLEGGHLHQLVNLPAAVIVLGGTFGATLIGLSARQLRDLPHILRQALVSPSIDISQTIRWLVTLSEKARREGLLALEADANAASDEFLKRALQLAIDGTDPSWCATSCSWRLPSWKNDTARASRSSPAWVAMPLLWACWAR